MAKNALSKIAKKEPTGTKQKISFPLVDSLRRLFAVADTIKSFYEDDTASRALDLNVTIASTLTSVLQNPEITKHNLDSVLNFSNLGMIHSDDKRLSLFTWYENTGGSFKSNLR